MTNKERLINYYKQHIKSNNLFIILTKHIDFKKKITIINMCYIWNLDDLNCLLEWYDGNLKHTLNTGGKKHAVIIDYYFINKKHQEYKEKYLLDEEDVCLINK